MTLKGLDMDKQP